MCRASTICCRCLENRSPEGPGADTNPTRKRGVFDYPERAENPLLAHRVSVLDLPRRGHFFRAMSRKKRRVFVRIIPARRAHLLGCARLRVSLFVGGGSDSQTSDRRRTESLGSPR